MLALLQRFKFTTARPLDLKPVSCRQWEEYETVRPPTPALDLLDNHAAPALEGPPLDLTYEVRLDHALTYVMRHGRSPVLGRVRPGFEAVPRM